ncbi:hypothetical protein D3C78_1629160 [compost metagenome]
MTLAVIEVHATGNQKIDFCPRQFNFLVPLTVFQHRIIQAQIDAEWATRYKAVNKRSFVATKVTVLGLHTTDCLYPYHDLIEQLEKPVPVFRSYIFSKINS